MWQLEKLFAALNLFLLAACSELRDWVEIITSGSLGMIKEKSQPVEVILSCLQIELRAPVSLMFHLFLITLAFLTPQGA